MRNICIIGSYRSRITWPIYVVDMKSGEVLHTVRVGEKPWAKIMGVDILAGYGHHSISPDEKKIFISITTPAAIILDLETFEEKYEPYLRSWWFWHKPKLMKKFERLGGAMELVRREKLLDKELGTDSWKWASNSGGGFATNRHVLVGAGNEARMYDVESGELIAREENPYFLKSIADQIRGVRRKLGPLRVRSVKVPPTSFLIAGTLLRKYNAWGYIRAPSTSSGMAVDPYFGDPHKMFLFLGGRDRYCFVYDFIRNEAPGWAGFGEEGWPVPRFGIVEDLRPYIRDRVEEILGKKIRRLKIRPTSYAVDPKGRFFVLAYEINAYYIEEGEMDWEYFSFVVWLDLRTGRLIHYDLSDVLLGIPHWPYVLPSGVTVVYASDGCLVYDYPSFRLIRYLDMSGDGDTERRVLDGFARAVGIGDRWVSLEESKYFYHCISVSPDLRHVAVFFGRSAWDLKKAGVYGGDVSVPRFLLDDSRYFGLSERVRREFRTMYVVVVDWDGEVVDVFSIYDERERCVRVGCYLPVWF